MKFDSILAILAVFAVVIALFNMGVTLTRVSDLRQRLTGYAASGAGYVNLTVNTQISVNFSRNSINWSAGLINGTGDNRFNATLYTVGETATRVRGNWSTADAKGLILENIGNVNASLTLQSNKNSSLLFGSLSGTNQQLMWNVSNKETGTCSGGNATMGNWKDVNFTAAETFCGQFSFNASNNELYVDVWLTVPYDANSTVVNNPISATFTATAATAG